MYERTVPVDRLPVRDHTAQVLFNLLVLTSVGISMLFFVSYQSVRCSSLAQGSLEEYAVFPKLGAARL